MKVEFLDDVEMLDKIPNTKKSGFFKLFPCGFKVERLSRFTE